MGERRGRKQEEKEDGRLPTYLQMKQTYAQEEMDAGHGPLRRLCEWQFVSFYTGHDRVMQWDPHHGR